MVRALGTLAERNRQAKCLSGSVRKEKYLSSDSYRSKFRAIRSDFTTWKSVIELIIGG
jgi:hypothetical protein